MDFTALASRRPGPSCPSESVPLGVLLPVIRGPPASPQIEPSFGDLQPQDPLSLVCDPNLEAFPDRSAVRG